MKLHTIVSLVGETNSGKSTLVNALINDKVSIVSHKVQTTRNRILGIYNNNNKQIIFIDTPGLFTPKKSSDSYMLRYSYNALEEANIIIIMLDVQKGITPIFNNLLNKLQTFKNKNIILVLNKIDLLDKKNDAKQLLDLSDKLYRTNVFKEIFMISALKKDGLIKLLSYLEKFTNMPGQLFDKEQSSNVTLNFWATEITREKIFKYVHKEIPYTVMVSPLLWKEKNNSIIIKQDIIVNKDSHKKILVGKAGITIKRISIESRKVIEFYLNKKVHLYLFVKVDKKVLDNEDLFLNNSYLSV